jgi:hypothetical protein
MERSAPVSPVQGEVGLGSDSAEKSAAPKAFLAGPGKPATEASAMHRRKVDQYFYAQAKSTEPPSDVIRGPLRGPRCQFSAWDEWPSGQARGRNDT